MWQRFHVVSLAMLLAATACSVQCDARITPVPLSKKPLVAPAGANLPKGMFVHYRYELGADSAILLYGQSMELPDPGYNDEGILIVLAGKVTRQRSLARLRVLASSDDYEKHNFIALSITRACTEGAPIYFAAFGYMGDMTSADLFLIIIPEENAYRISALPLVSGGTLDLSRSEPLRVRTWNNLGEGSCNACDTHYWVSEFTLREGAPMLVKRFRTRRMYSSDDAMFDDRLRVRLIP